MKQLFNLIILCLTVSLLSACGEKKITVKGADGTEYESYQECCAEQDFQAAHQYLAKMQNDEDFKGDYYSAKEFVFKQEALYLMSLGDETSKKRIIYLLKEEGADNNRIDMLMDLAIDADDEDFVKTLTKQYEGSISSDMLRKIVEFLYIEKGDSNLDFVQTLLNRYNKSGLLLDAAVEKRDEELVVRLAQQFNGSLSFKSFKTVIDFLKSKESPRFQQLFDLLSTKVSEKRELFKYAVENKKTQTVIKLGAEYLSIDDEEITTQMASFKNISINGILIGKLTEKMVPKKNVGTRYSSGSTEYYDHATDGYADEISEYNMLCNKLLDCAIRTGNKDLAQKTLSVFLQNVVSKHYGGIDTWRDVTGYCNTDRDAAQKKYNEAVRSGAFK